MSNCHKAVLGPALASGKKRIADANARNGHRVSPIKLPSGLRSGKLTNLRDLNLSCCMLLDDEAVIELTKALPAMQVCKLGFRWVWTSGNVSKIPWYYKTKT